jgi:hypothetical protein
VVRLQYNRGTVQAAPAAAGRERAEADFDAEEHQTEIQIERATGEQEVTRPGLVLLQVRTSRGTLAMTF